ncbi:MAG: NADH:flavin oxidoreductase/NADH oxidase [Betaproteobacteria bacterium]|nr:NADH:flavin oxidoreductase/NADH oxidase [Betaproteobacteria bacterium]MDH3438604.1 NADH:flavin oxidoreductase/NADH oxidase [Betaproteobacteria bacterium]
METKTPTNVPAQQPDAERKVLQRDPTPHIFRPISFRSVTARNRIMVSPMCQYSAIDGVPGDWHLQHLGCRAVGGAGIVITEMTNVEARGRITPGCLGLWNDEQRDAFARIARFVKAQGAVAGIQLAHAGRKASTAAPWDGGKPMSPENGGWPIVAPSPIHFGDGYAVPQDMDEKAVAGIVTLFAASARRAREAGFDLIELHGAHGYLISTFLSPITNRRTDRYGGSFENRIRFLLEIVDAVRSEWPDDKPLFVRISCTDWMEGGWDLEASVELAQRLRAGGKVDLVDCSSGGVDPRQKVGIYPGYQVPFAAAVRSRTGIATGAVGLISSPEMAEQIVASGQADIVVMARAFLHDPYWPMHAAKALRAKFQWPKQYERGDIF